MRDAIVYSNASWEVFNVPERIALALVCLGARVLYCEHPRSIFRNTRFRNRAPEPSIRSFEPACLADRLNRLPVIGSLQMRVIAQQILDKANALQLNRPLFFYPWLGSQLSLLRHLRGKFSLVHLQLDYGEPNIADHVEISDVTLAIPRSVYHQQRGRYGEKVQLVPQAVELRTFNAARDVRIGQSSTLSHIPRPRLGYLGPASHRINKPLLAELLRKHPEWHFVSVDREKVLPLPNVHAVPWRSGHELAAYASAFDVGFMPYDCLHGHNFHCLPLKLFEYFALGLPVVSTPIIELWDLKELVYVGDTMTELADAVKLALQEPLDSAKRRRRMELASEHSIECLATALTHALPLNE